MKRFLHLQAERFKTKKKRKGSLSFTAIVEVVIMLLLLFSILLLLSTAPIESKYSNMQRESQYESMKAIGKAIAEVVLTDTTIKTSGTVMVKDINKPSKLWLSVMEMDEGQFISHKNESLFEVLSLYAYAPSSIVIHKDLDKYNINIAQETGFSYKDYYSIKTDLVSNAFKDLDVYKATRNLTDVEISSGLIRVFNEKDVYNDDFSSILYLKSSSERKVLNYEIQN